MPTPGFAHDIRPLFTDIDVDHMSEYFDLSKYEDVKNNATKILNRLNATDGHVMPPPPQKGGDGPWSPEKIAQFKAWIAGGFLP